MFQIVRRTLFTHLILRRNVGKWRITSINVRKNNVIFWNFPLINLTQGGIGCNLYRLFLFISLNKLTYDLWPWPLGFYKVYPRHIICKNFRLILHRDVGEKLLTHSLPDSLTAWLTVWPTKSLQWVSDATQIPPLCRGPTILPGPTPWFYY